MEKRIHPLWPTLAVFAGLVALFFGERVLAGDSGTRTALAVVGGALVAAAIVVRGLGMASAPAEKAPVARLLFLTTLGVGVALGLYALVALVFTADDAKDARAILWTLFPITLVCSATPLAAIELATAPAAFIDRYELRRVKRAFERGLALAMLVSVLFLGNFIAARHEVKWDLSYGQKTVASESTKKAVRELTQPVKVRLFFPKANEVAEVLETYFASLKAENPNLTVERLDHALAGAIAKDVGVTENGFMSVSWEKAHDKVRIGDKLQSARTALRKLDSSFVTSLIKVTQQKRTAYFTTGHAERTAATGGEKDPRSPTKYLKDLLEKNQYTVRNLGIAEGLADKLPKDASMIFIMGAEKPFSDAELATLNAATERGARVLVALEGERDGDDLKAFLEPLGLRFEKTILANERTNVPLSRTDADRALIWSNRYSSHESVTTMTRSAKLATVFGRSGYLVKADKTPDKLKVDMVLTAVDDTFADLNGNLAFDKDSEKKQPFGLAAAITKTSTTGKKNDETRIFVIADVDVFSDDLLKFEGNVNLLADIVYWLRAADAPVVPPTSTEDVQIVHKKEDDALWFWSTTVGVPALVLALGMFGTKRRRR